MRRRQQANPPSAAERDWLVQSPVDFYDDLALKVAGSPDRLWATGTRFSRWRWSAMPFQFAQQVVAVPGFECCFALVPFHGETVNGDGLFAETARLDASHLLLLVDVTHHGQRAASTVDLLEHHLLQDPLCQNKQPAELLTILNGMLQQEFAATGNWVAAQAFLLSQGGVLVGGNAGCPDPLLWRRLRRTRRHSWRSRRRMWHRVWRSWLLPGDAPLGVPALDTQYQEEPIVLRSGEFLLAFSDGVTEAGAKTGPQFQHVGFRAWLAGLTAGLSVSGVVSQLLTVLETHVGNAWPDDDTTVLCLRRV